MNIPRFRGDCFLTKGVAMANPKKKKKIIERISIFLY